MKFLSRVYYTNKNQLHAEGISPIKRRTIADGQHDFHENEQQDYTIAVDTALHRISIQAKHTARKKTANGEKIECRKYLVMPKRDDLFVRKIPKAIWLTDDSRKILVRMDVAVPIGKARIVLDEYSASKS